MTSLGLVGSAVALGLTLAVLGAAACGGNVTTPAPTRCTPGAPVPSVDGCNSCVCGNDGTTSVCTTMACADASPGTDASTACKTGDTKQVDCNTCSCTDGTWACTKRACFDAGAVNPGVVTCAGQPCATIDHVCCDLAEPTATPDEHCTLKGAVCGPTFRSCDEAADCDPGEVCCQQTSAAYPLRYATECRPKGSCTDSKFAPQFCTTDAECDNHLSCTRQTCWGRAIATCGGVPVARCQ